MKLKFGGWTSPIGVLALVLSMAQSANALDWEVKRVYVEEAHIFKQSGNSVVRVVYEKRADSTVLDSSFGCSPNKDPITSDGNLYHAAYWDGGADTYVELYISTLLAAQAQGLPVDIRFESSGCNESGSTYGLGGLGRKIAGVKVISQ